MYISNSSILKTIEDKTTESGYRLASCFEKIHTELNALREKGEALPFSFGEEFEKNLHADMAALKEVQDELSNPGDNHLSAPDARAKYLTEVSVAANEFAKKHDMATAGLEEFEIAQSPMVRNQLVTDDKVKARIEKIRALNLTPFLSAFFVQLRSTPNVDRNFNYLT